MERANLQNNPSSASLVMFLPGGIATYEKSFQWKVLFFQQNSNFSRFSLYRTLFRSVSYRLWNSDFFTLFSPLRLQRKRIRQKGQKLLKSYCAIFSPTLMFTYAANPSKSRHRLKTEYIFFKREWDRLWLRMGASLSIDYVESMQIKLDLYNQIFHS